MNETVQLVRPGQLVNIEEHGIVELESPYWPDVNALEVLRARPAHHKDTLQVRRLVDADVVKPAKARTLGPQLVITGGVHGARYEVQTAVGYGFFVTVLPIGFGQS